MAKEYVALRNGCYYVVGGRVSLDSVVYAYLNGESADGILESYPALNEEQVHGMLAFYLANRAEVDKYLADARVRYEELRQKSRLERPEFYARRAAARDRARASRA